MIKYSTDKNNIITGFIIVETDVIDTEEDINKAKLNCDGCHTYIDGKIQQVQKPDYILLDEAKLELQDIQLWFEKNDWKINKIVVGEWTTDDPRWIDYINERSSRRVRQDELNELINSIEN